MKVKIILSFNLSILAFLAFFLTTIFACSSKKKSNSFDYGTKSDSARYYYLNGFHEILDNGRWTESEKSYRKAVEFDPDYTLGKSLVGRITRDLDERENLLKELVAAKHETSEDERLLLEVYLSSMEAYNNREKGIKRTPEYKSKRKQLIVSNFREFVQKYPHDDYVKAEYIEWIHSIHGPKAALDSLKHLATERQMKLGFYIGYSASLELELGNVEKAKVLSKKLKKLMIDSTYTSYMTLKVQIYMANDSLQKAKALIDKIVTIDPNHIIAYGMQSEINEKLKNK
jgi:tetratricopeptide (TPR) repeat protein